LRCIWSAAVCLHGQDKAQGERLETSSRALVPAQAFCWLLLLLLAVLLVLSLLLLRLGKVSTANSAHTGQHC